jgi:ADP-heptose:LPS heptosyltransferase
MIVGVQPGTSATMRWKQWPLERYRELIERILEETTGTRIVLFGSAGEQEMIEGLVGGLGSRVTVAAGKTTVKQVAALIEK